MLRFYQRFKNGSPQEFKNTRDFAGNAIAKWQLIFHVLFESLEIPAKVTYLLCKVRNM